MEATQKKIGAQIAALQRAKGLTQEQLAEMLGVSAPAVSKWETDSSDPDITLLCPLARALGTNLDTLLQFEEDLPDKEVIDRINALMEQTLAEGSPNGWKKVEEGLEELLCRWPGCALLLYNGAAVYDTLRVFFPGAGEENFARWRVRKRNLMERVRAFGFLDTSDGFLMEWYLRQGQAEKAAECFAAYVEALAGPAVYPSETLFSPGLGFKKKEEQMAAFQEMRRMLWEEIQKEERCRPMRGLPAFEKALEKLGQSLA